MKEVYLLWHENEVTDDFKLLGVFDTEIDANLAVEYYKNISGFSDFPNGFTIDCYKIGEKQWLEGF
jgi:homoserine kinase type II